MSIAIDLILAIIMLSIIATAVRRGFVVSVFKLLSAVAAVVVAALFYKQLGSFFYDSFVYDKIFASLSDWLQKLAQNADGSFDTTSRVTRQMAATVLLRLLRQSNVVFEADMSMLDRYPDSASISDWAKEAVAMMTQYDLMNGTTKGFEPKKDMTLEQCLVLLTRICEF